MHSATALLSALLVYSVSAHPVDGCSDTLIFVAGYDGYVRTVSLSADGQLSEISKTDGCKTNPSWLFLNKESRQLWCLDEGFDQPHGTLNSFDIEDSGDLVQTQRVIVSAGPVQSTFYNVGSSLAVAVAQFGGSVNSTIRGGLTGIRVLDDGTLDEKVVNVTFDALAQPGPGPMQDVPRGHGVVLDPTFDKTLVVTDYGADKIRLFAINEDGFSAGPEYETPVESAPRHSKFATVAGQTYLYVLEELANTITTYPVGNSNDQLLYLLPPTHVIDTFGGTASAETLKKANAAEILISSDNKFVLVSNRHDGSFPDSDSLATYSINADGSLSFMQLVPVGGIAPRHFTLNQAGDKVLVAVQESSKITVLERDPQTGMVGGILSSLDFDTTVETGKDPAGIPAAMSYE